MGTAEPRVAPTVKIAGDGTFSATGGGPVAAPVPSGGQAQVSRPSAAVPLFPPIAPATPLAAEMPRTISQAPGAAAMPRSMSQPPGQASAAPRTSSRPPDLAAEAPRKMSQPPGGSQPRSHASPPVGTPAVARNGASAGARPSAPISRPSGKPVTRPSIAPVHGDSSAARGGRRWGLIVLLVIIDLGLAGSGAFMLLRGLAEPSPGDVPSTTQPKAP